MDNKKLRPPRALFFCDQALGLRNLDILYRKGIGCHNELRLTAECQKKI